MKGAFGPLFFLFVIIMFKHLTLGDVLVALQKEDPEKMLKFGLTYGHSYRGYYDQVAFELSPYISVGNMKKEVEEAVNHTYTGWKGGEYSMNLTTPVWVADLGGTGDPLTRLTLMLLLSNEILFEN